MRIIETDGLVSGTLVFAPFNETNIGSTTAIAGSLSGDITASIWDGSGSLAVQSRNNISEALSFTGSSTGVKLEGHIIMAATMTVSAWIEPTNVAWFQPQTITTNQQLGAYVLGGFWLGISGGNNQVVQWYGCYDITTINDCVMVSTIQPVPLNEWTYVTVTHNYTDVKIYYNGAEVTTRTIWGAVQDADLDVSRVESNSLTLTSIGYQPSSLYYGNMNWIGGIDDATYIDRAATADEICYLYKGIAASSSCTSSYASTTVTSSSYTCASGISSDNVGGQSSLLIWYRFDWVNGAFPDYAIDYTGNGYHGIWHNVFNFTTALDSVGTAALQLHPVSVAHYYPTGSSDSIEYGSAIDVGVLDLATVTFCAWISVSSFNGNPVIFSNALDDDFYYRTTDGSVDDIYRESFTFGLLGQGKRLLRLFFSH
jgi:hypothetical protein